MENFIEGDLLTALTLVPADEKEVKYRQAYASVMDQLIAAEEAQRRAEPGAQHDRIGYEFQYGFSALFAKFVLRQDVEGGAVELLDKIIAAIDRAPELAAQVLQDVLAAEDESTTGERFWLIWERCTERAYSLSAIRGSSRVIGYSEYRTLLRTMLFAETPWKKGLNSWAPLKDHSDFVRRAFLRVGDTPAGFAALLRLLRTIGSFLLPDALLDLDDARRRCSAPTLIENESARYDLELVLRDCVLSMGTALRTRDSLRRAALDLLDFLVDEGSSLAFQLREFIVAPTRAEGPVNATRATK